MPVEIKELVIRAVVNEKAEERGSQMPRPSGDSEEIVAECVKQVLKILNQSKER